MASRAGPGWNGGMDSLEIDSAGWQAVLALRDGGGMVALRFDGRDILVPAPAGEKLGGPFGAFWMIRRIVRDNFTWEAALEEARRVGLAQSPHLEEFARKYVETHPRR